MPKKIVPTEKQAEFLVNTEFEGLYGGAAGGGKALDINTPIPTPDGWTTMGDVQPGDIIFGADGQPCTVLAISDVMKDRPCYRVVFDDGSSLVADEDHQWFTYDARDLSAMTRRTDEYRELRRSSRKSRGIGTRPDLSERNRQSAHAQDHNPGSIKTTRMISETLMTRGRKNHAIPVNDAIVTQEQVLPIAPYVLGSWLGDGTSLGNGLTSNDPEIVASIESLGHPVTKRAGRYDYGIAGITTKLRLLGVLGNKHIPSIYLRSSVEQRLDLLRGLMDTDGEVGVDGRSIFTGTNPRLVADVLELCRTLGIKATMRQGVAKIDGRVIGPKWSVGFTTSLPVFRLTRKLSRIPRETRRTTRLRYVASVHPVDSVPVKCIRVDRRDGLFLAGTDMVVTHNSDALMIAASQFLHVPGYSAVLFRRTKPLLSRPGGLISRADRWWRNTGARWVDDDSTWYFPCPQGGYSSITFGYMENEKDKYNWLAYEFQFVGFDELTEFTEGQYKFLFNRMRMTEEMAEAGMILRMRGASNPGNTGHEWVRSRFILRDPWPDNEPYYEEDSDQWLDPPFFIPARLEDNPYVNQKSYLRSLGHLDPVTRQQYLKGNWDASSGGAQLKREWFKPLTAMPYDVVFGVRHWDLAATVPTEGNKNKADWTAGALVLVTSEGRILIHDIERFQGTPGTVEERVRLRTYEDLTIVHEQGFPILTTMEQEGGASGKIVIDHYMNGVLAGFPFVGIVSSGKKELRSVPLANQAEAGNVAVYIDPDAPESAAWIRKFLDELDLYPFGDHDDQVDAVAGATNYLLQGGFVREAIPLVAQQFDWKSGQMTQRSPTGYLPERRSSWRTPALS